MDRIWGDEFVLVTGGGKVYNKSNLLSDARGNPTYEHNEELEQNVREHRYCYRETVGKGCR